MSHRIGHGKIIIILIMLMGGGLAPGAQAAQDQLLFQSGPTRVPLLELYTSEGCSSCPSADRWLTGLVDDPGLWIHYTPLSLHVDYWNRLGWQDRLSSAKYTERQRTYARMWRSRTVYTPGFVYDGREWKNWHGGRVPPQPKEAGGLLRVFAAAPENFRVEYTPTDQTTSWVGHAAILGMGITTEVGAGENSGRFLQHDFAVLALQTGHLVEQQGRFSGTFALIPPADVKVQGMGMAVWVSQEGQITPVQSVGGYLTGMKE